MPHSKRKQKRDVEYRTSRVALQRKQEQYQEMILQHGYLSFVKYTRRGNVKQELIIPSSVVPMIVQYLTLLEGLRLGQTCCRLHQKYNEKTAVIRNVNRVKRAHRVVRYYLSSQVLAFSNN